MNTIFRKLTLLFFLYLTLFSNYSFAQETIWLDKNHNQTTKKDGIYYRPIPQKKRSGLYVIDYYRNGAKYREGKAKSARLNKENYYGTVTYYFNEGSIFKKENYKEGVLDGNYTEYFETGQIQLMGKYEDGLQEGTWKIFHKSGKIKSKGKYRKGEKVGIWKTYYKNVYYPEDE